MQKLYVVLSLALLLVVAIFALANNTNVPVNFPGFQTWRTSVAILILISFTAGVVLMGLFDLGRQVKSWKNAKVLQKQLRSAEEERDLLKNRVAELIEQAAATAAKSDTSES